jgi:hypothetical protein
MSNKRNINQFITADFLFKLSHESWPSLFEGNDVNTILNSFLNKFIMHYNSSFPMIRVNRWLSPNSWITSDININNPGLKKYFYDYC